MKLLITRPSPPSPAFIETLAHHHIAHDWFPCLNIIPLAQENAAEQAMQFNAADYVIVTSMNAARQLPTTNTNIHRTLLCVGPATAKVCHEIGFTHCLFPDAHSTEGLLAMPQLIDTKDKTIVIVTGENPRPDLANTLRSRGAHVILQTVYRREPIQYTTTTIQRIMHEDCTHILAMSNETLHQLNTLFSKQNQNNWLHKKQLIVSAQRQSATAKQLGFQQIISIKTAEVTEVVSVILSSQATNS